jgi:hypothetical protein
MAYANRNLLIFSFENLVSYLSKGIKVAKGLALFAVLLSISAFIAGCEPEAMEGPQVENPEVETGKIESPEVESPEPESSNVEAPETEDTEPNRPETVEPSKTEPNEIEPITVEPLKTEPNEAEPTTIEPNENEATNIEPNEVEPNEIGPTRIEPNEVEPIKGEPNKVEPRVRVTFHEKCADILSTFVDKNGMVDYTTLDRKSLKLKAVLREFANLDRKEYDRWPKEDKIALWINAYNLQMLNVITKNYPIKASRILKLFWPPSSIRHIGGIWTDYKFIVMNEQFTLKEVEQRYLRRQFDEPRVFFAICNASLGSPPLRNEPYCGEKLYEQLDDQAKKFLSSPQGFRIEKNEQTVYLSAILQTSWFGKEFSSKYGTIRMFKDQEVVTRAVLNFITNYVRKEDVSYLQVENYSVNYIKYDWRLNDGS